MRDLSYARLKGVIAAAACIAFLAAQLLSDERMSTVEGDTQSAEPPPPRVPPRILFHMPPYSEYTCSMEDPETCGHLEPVPMHLPSPLVDCGLVAESDHHRTHNFLFAHAMLVQKRLQKMTGVTMLPVADPFIADVVFCSSKGVAALVRNQTTAGGPWTTRPLIVVLETRDPATTSVPLHVLQDTRTVAVLKTYAFKDYGGPCCNFSADVSVKGTRQCENRHIEFMRFFELGGSWSPSAASAIAMEKNCTSWPPELQKKFMIATPQWMTVRHGAHVAGFPSHKQIMPIHQRPVDISFAGVVNYAHLDIASRYRSRFVKELRNACRHHSWDLKISLGRMDKKSDFYNLLMETKIFISPWGLGLGEWSSKDEEAILHGAVLLKPGASLFRSSIPMYTPGSTCLEVRPDGKDLEAVLKAALGKGGAATLQKIQSRALKAQRLFVSYGQAVRHPSVLAKWSDLVKRMQAAL